MKDSEVRIGGHLPAVAYCATCGWSFRPYKEEENKLARYRGRVLECPYDNEPSASALPAKKEEYKRRPSHLARVVQGDIGKFWLRWQRRFRNYELLYSPHRLNNHWEMDAWFRDRAGIWGLIRLGLLLIVSRLVFEDGGLPFDIPMSVLRRFSIALAVWLGIVALLEIIRTCIDPYLPLCTWQRVGVFLYALIPAVAVTYFFDFPESKDRMISSVVVAGLAAYLLVSFLMETFLVYLREVIHGRGRFSRVLIEREKLQSLLSKLRIQREKFGNGRAEPLRPMTRAVVSGFSLIVAVVVEYILWNFGDLEIQLARFSLGVLAAYLALDILIPWTSAAFTRRVPASSLRSVQGLFVSYLSLVVAFATFYGFLPSCSFNVKLDWIRSLYFSLVTIVTLGYGDIAPATDAPGAMLLVVVEVLVGLYFLAVLFTIVVGWVGAFPSEPPLKACLYDIYMYKYIVIRDSSSSPPEVWIRGEFHEPARK